MANDPLPSSGLMWPTFVSTILRSGTQQTTMILVGHLGSRELGAVALGTLWVSMTGMSLVFGGMSGLDTLASQAFGAKNYELVGLWAQRAVVVLVLVCFPLFFSWFYLTGPMLELVGIEPEIAEMAQHFSKIQCLWMFPVFMNRCIQSFWRAQRIVKPYTNMSYISFLLHIPTCYFFVNRWGFTGAAFSLPVNQWCLMFLLLTYDYRKRFSAQCWRPWDSACLSGHAPLLKLAAGGTLTMMGDAWSWHVLSGMAGLLGECVGHPATSLSLCLCLSLSLSVSLCLSTLFATMKLTARCGVCCSSSALLCSLHHTTLHCRIPLAAHVVLQSLNQLCFPLSFAIGTAATTRVGNQLGAGEGKAAKRIVGIGLTTSVCVQVSASIIVYSQRERAAFIYTNEVAVVDAVKAVAGVFFLFQFVSGLNQTCRGVLAGCGKQALNGEHSRAQSWTTRDG
jgi:MATE family multidrug resistance protein